MNHDDNNVLWRVLCWNVRALNSDTKRGPVKAKIVEANCDIIYLQETKTETFNELFLKIFCPAGCTSFFFKSAIGTAGGLITIWKSSKFSGKVIDVSDFALTIEFVLSKPG